MPKKATSSHSKRKSYLTKRILISAARSGVRDAARNTMAVMGFVVVAEDGWVVRKYPNGDSERIEPIPQPDNPKVVLD